MDIISEGYGVDQVAIGPARPEPVVSVRGLVKRYGSVEAVAGIDLEVRRGEIFAFLGPNGAGKTTTVEILEGFGQRTAGQVCVLGQDPATAGGAWRDRVGVVLQEAEPEPGLTVRECLALYAGFYRAPRDIDQTIALAGLTEHAGMVGTRLSGGQRRGLDFALALIGDPELIFLDEPTTGFDPSARRAAWAVIAGLRQLGKTIFLTTHYLDEAEYLADQIAVLSAGRIVAEGTPQTLGGRDHMTTAISFTLPDQVHARLAGSQAAHVDVAGMGSWSPGHPASLRRVLIRVPCLFGSCSRLDLFAQVERSRHQKRPSVVWRLGGNGLTEIPQLDDLPVLESEQTHRGDAEVAGLEDDVGVNRDQVAVAHGVLDRQLLVEELLVVLLHAGLESVEAGGERCV